MKSKSIILLSCILVLLCSYIILSPKNDVEKVSTEDVGEFQGVVADWGINIDFTNEIPLKGFIVNEKLALEIADDVWRSLGREKMIEETEFIVCEIEGKDLFVVTRIPQKLQRGGGYNIAISKSNGRILKIWGDE